MSILAQPDDEFDYFHETHKNLRRFGDDQFRAFWLWTDVGYARDREDFESVSPDVQRMIELTIAFFFSSDGIVFNNVGSNFSDEFKSNDVRYTYTAIAAIELIHAKSYGIQLDTIVSNPNKKRILKNAIREIPSVKRMADWAREYTSREKYPLLERLIAFLCVEGIFFQSPFGNIFWLRSQFPGKFEGILAANDLISRDENLHCEFACALILELKKEGHRTSRTAEIFRSAVEVAIDFVKDTLPNGLLGLNAEMMSNHVRFVSNQWLRCISEEPLYPKIREPPLDFFGKIALDIFKNFFEKTTGSTEYQKCPPQKITYQVPDEF